MPIDKAVCLQCAVCLRCNVGSQIRLKRLCVYSVQCVCVVMWAVKYDWKGYVFTVCSVFVCNVGSQIRLKRLCVYSVQCVCVVMWAVKYKNNNNTQLSSARVRDDVIVPLKLYWWYAQQSHHIIVSSIQVRPGYGCIFSVQSMYMSYKAIITRRVLYKIVKTDTPELNCDGKVYMVLFVSSKCSFVLCYCIKHHVV